MFYSYINVVYESWNFVSYRLMGINLCDKYGKPMSNQKKLWAGHESALTDRQTDGQTEWFLYTPPPPELRSGGDGGYN